MSYKIQALGPVKDVTTANGAFKVYSLHLDNNQWVDLMQKPETAAPTVGQVLEGTIEATQYGVKFKRAQTGSGGFQGGRGKSPDEMASIARQVALKCGVEALRDFTTFQALGSKSTPESYAEKAVELAAIFDSFLQGTAKTSDLPSTDDLPPVDQLKEPF